VHFRNEIEFIGHGSFGLQAFARSSITVWPASGWHRLGLAEMHDPSRDLA